MHFDWDWPAAAATVKRMLEVAPDSSSALSRAGVIANAMGRFDEAIEFGRRACEQDPLSARSYIYLGLPLHAAGRLIEAEAAFRKALELAPERAAIRNSLALVLLDQGRAEEAMVEALAEPDPIFHAQAVAIVAHALGRPEEAGTALDELVRLGSADGAFQIAEVHGKWGAADEAFRWLDRAYDQRDPGFSQAKSSMCLVGLHGDPRWGALMRKLRLDG